MRADDVRQRRGFHWLARIGLLSRGIVYLLLGSLVLEIVANGRPSSSIDSEGAFAAIARRPADPEMLALICAGLAAYAVWRLVEAISKTPQDEKPSPWTRVGWVGIGLLYVALCAEAAEILWALRPGAPSSIRHPSLHTFCGSLDARSLWG